MTDLPERLRFDWAWFEQAASHWDRTRAVTECVALLEKHHGTMAEAAAEIERLTAALASEREACALVAESGVKITSYGTFVNDHDVHALATAFAKTIASAIRARGEK